jgi:phage gp45-like
VSAFSERLYRRVLNMVAPVKITATDDSGPVHRTQVRGYPPETIDAMPVLQVFGLATHAPPGSDGMAIFGSGDRSNGVIVATGHQASRPKGQPQGGTTLYDSAGTSIVLDAGGNITITAKGKVRVVTPRLEVTGDIIDHCDEQSNTDADMRRIYNSHTHSGVQRGSGDTDPPLQPQRMVEP